MGKIGETYFHITRYTFSKIQEINQRSSNPVINLNSMVWDIDIYLNHEKDLIEINKFNNGILYELSYLDYRLFFIREYQKEPYRNNVFWVNILSKGTLYEKYKNELILTYKFGDFKKGNVIAVNGMNYTAINTGNSFNRYCQIKKEHSASLESNKKYWADIIKNLNGNPTELEFLTSTFGHFIIVYGVKVI